MKIYHFALAIFIFVGFSSVVTSMGVFANIYSHTPEVNMTVDESDIEGIKQISGEDILSSDDFLNSNPDTGGILSFIPGFNLLIKILDQTINVDKLILEYTPLSARDTVQPLANFFATIMQVIYGIGIISFLRKYKVG
jgi:hypothetical protein